MCIRDSLEVVPVINKIDLPSAQPEMVINEIEDVIGIPAEDAPQVSAKTGLNAVSYTHLFELEENDFVNVCIDLAMRGVGSKSCGPDLPPEYEIPKTYSNTFKFVF